MNLIQKIWNNFKTQPDVWFFYGFLATFTLSIRKILFSYPIDGQFNEYTGIYLYLSDILIIFFILFWAISILRNKYSILSRIKATRVPRGTFLIPLILVIWSFISIFWSSNPSIAIFKSAKLLEFYLLFLYIIIQIVPRGTIVKNSFKIITTIGVIQSIVGIWQFIIQHSIGLFWLKESLISPEIAGVAKLIFNNEKVIRAYGLFPHPNIFGGFLFLSILLTIAHHKLFHVEHSTSQSTIDCSTWNKSRCEVYEPTKNVPRGIFYKFWQDIATSDYTYPVSLATQWIALILTFSKSAILGLFLALFYIHKQKNISSWLDRRRTTSNAINHNMFHVEHIGRKLIFLFGIVLALGIITKPDTNSLLFKSVTERLFYLNVSRGTILAHPLIGSGNNQFVFGMTKFVPRGTNLVIWQYQPVHNVFLLIWSELGFIGLVLFVLLLWKLIYTSKSAAIKPVWESPAINCSTWNKSHCEVYDPTKNVPRGTFTDLYNLQPILKGVLIGFAFIMLFDHYLWDIQQGQIMLWLAMALITSL